MKKLFFVFLLCFSSAIYAQSNSYSDLSGWFWVQIYKPLPKDFYVSFQYQLRVNENVSQFDLSNLYFVGGWNANKYVNVEALYQYSTSYQDDGHTFYAGVTGKYEVKRFTFYARTAFQHRRNNFTEVYNIDHVKNEWRNRIRIKYKISDFFNISFACEPYLLFTEIRPAYISRIRSGVHFAVVFNKYQTLTAYYLYQPDIVSYKIPFTQHVIGLTWQVKIPDSKKGFKKMFQSKIFKPKKIKGHNGNSDNDSN